METLSKTIYTPAYRQFVGRLRHLRRTSGLRQCDVGSKLGVTRHWVAKIERCETRLDVVQLVMLCHVYGASPRELLQQLESDLSDQDGSLLYLSERAAIVSEPAGLPPHVLDNASLGISFGGKLR